MPDDEQTGTIEDVALQPGREMAWVSVKNVGSFLLSTKGKLTRDGGEVTFGEVMERIAKQYPLYAWFHHDPAHYGLCDKVDFLTHIGGT
jgi:hypothetical protein